MSSRIDYQNQVNDLLKELNSDIEKLKSQVHKAEDQALSSYQEHLEELISQRDLTKRQIEKLRDASDENWNQFKADVEHSLQGLHQQFARIIQKVVEDEEVSAGWAEGLKTVGPTSSKGWPEGLAEKGPEESEGWVEGVGEKLDDSKGWVEGYDQDEEKE